MQNVKRKAEKQQLTSTSDLVLDLLKASAGSSDQQINRKHIQLKILKGSGGQNQLLKEHTKLILANQVNKSSSSSHLHRSSGADINCQQNQQKNYMKLSAIKHDQVPYYNKFYHLNNYQQEVEEMQFLEKRNIFCRPITAEQRKQNKVKSQNQIDLEQIQTKNISPVRQINTSHGISRVYTSYINQREKKQIQEDQHDQVQGLQINSGQKNISDKFLNKLKTFNDFNLIPFQNQTAKKRSVFPKKNSSSVKLFSLVDCQDQKQVGVEDSEIWQQQQQKIISPNKKNMIKVGDVLLLNRKISKAECQEYKLAEEFKKQTKFSYSKYTQEQISQNNKDVFISKINDNLIVSNQDQEEKIPIFYQTQNNRIDRDFSPIERDHSQSFINVKIRQSIDLLTTPKRISKTTSYNNKNSDWMPYESHNNILKEEQNIKNQIKKISQEQNILVNKHFRSQTISHQNQQQQEMIQDENLDQIQYCNIIPKISQNQQNNNKNQIETMMTKTKENNQKLPLNRSRSKSDMRKVLKKQHQQYFLVIQLFWFQVYQSNYQQLFNLDRSKKNNINKAKLQLLSRIQSSANFL